MQVRGKKNYLLVTIMLNIQSFIHRKACAQETHEVENGASPKGNQETFISSYWSYHFLLSSLSHQLLFLQSCLNFHLLFMSDLNLLPLLLLSTFVGLLLLLLLFSPLWALLLNEPDTKDISGDIKNTITALETRQATTHKGQYFWYNKCCIYPALLPPLLVVVAVWSWRFHPVLVGCPVQWGRVFGAWCWLLSSQHGKACLGNGWRVQITSAICLPRQWAGCHLQSGLVFWHRILGSGQFSVMKLFSSCRSVCCWSSAALVVEQLS